MKAKEDYQKEFNVLSRAGTGVVLTRAREPFRVIASLRETAAKSNLTFKLWNIVGGWHDYSNGAASDSAALKDKTINPHNALKKLADLDGDGANAWDDGIYVMDGLHPFLGEKPDPVLVAILRQYAYSFATMEKRLVLTVPEAFVLPHELQHDIIVLDYALPDRIEVGMILDEVIEGAFNHPDEIQEVFSAVEKEGIVSSACGMTRLEAESAFAQGLVRTIETFPQVPFDEFNKIVLTTKTDVVKRSEVLELMKAGNVSEVGGLDQLKAWVGMRKACFTKEAEDFGADRPKGIALIGPPGTGKSISAKAIAATLGQPLIRFDVSRVFGSLVGQSEGRVRAALKQLEAMAPCVAFIDEIDKAGLSAGSGNDSGTSTRVLGSILTFMQESPAPIFWLFTANRVAGLPSELLRKGRLDEVFAVLPPNSVEREEILRIHLKARKQDPSAIEDLQSAVESSAGYVSAEIEAAVKEAVVQAFHFKKEVTGADIVDQLANMKPISVAFADDFEKMRAWAENNARLASTPEAKTSKTMIKSSPLAPRKRRIGA
jgi:ATP-dependent 26S proteasome regulatory subunit